jgi:hypothetical protein
LLLFVTFFTVGNFEQLLFTVEKGYGLYCIDRATGKGCILIFFLIFFLQLRGKGVEVNLIFFASLEMWKEEGGNGYIFSLFKKYRV